MFPYQKTIPDNIGVGTNIRPSPKTRNETLPWQTLTVMMLLMEAKKNMANQTKSRQTSQKPWARANRKGSSLKILPI